MQNAELYEELTLNELAIVTASDERYAPLAKGLILSLRALGFPQPSQQLCLLDIGCSDATLKWMDEQGVVVAPLNAQSQIPFPTGHLPRFVTAMAFRPFMRDVFRDFRVYLWIDSDAWVQQASTIRTYHQLASNANFDIAISPLIDVNYKLHYTAKAFQQDLDRVYRKILGEVGGELAWFPVLSAGVFAMRRDSKIWNAWGEALASVYKQDYRDAPDALHLAEQTALNRLVYLLNNPAYLDAVHNYHLCAGSARWEQDKLVIPHTDRTIGIVHLCAFGVNAETYLKGKAMYDRGSYLSEAEIAALRRLKMS